MEVITEDSTSMKIVEATRVAMLTALLAGSGSPALAQQNGPAGTKAETKGPGDRTTIDSINAEHDRQVLALERRRLDQLGRLATSQLKYEANPTYDVYFRLAIAKGLYAEAEPIADRLVRSEGVSPDVSWLAHLVSIVAKAERGAYEESLAGLASAVHLKDRQPNKGAGAATLPVGLQATIVDAYYQRLVRDDQFDVARKAMRLIVDKGEVPAIRDLAAGRLKQLELVGRAAPLITGLDLDGKPVRPEALRGKVVLVVFWASWCLPSAQEMPWLDQAYRTHRGEAFQIIGVNLDAGQEGGPDIRAATPGIRRFLVDHNVTWPNLINGQGDQDFAKAFGVNEIPANVLIDRDGKVAHLDLNGPRLDKAITKALILRR